MVRTCWGCTGEAPRSLQDHIRSVRCPSDKPIQNDDCVVVTVRHESFFITSMGFLDYGGLVFEAARLSSLKDYKRLRLMSALAVGCLPDLVNEASMWIGVQGWPVWFYIEASVVQ